MGAPAFHHHAQSPALCARRIDFKIQAATSPWRPPWYWQPSEQELSALRGCRTNCSCITHITYETL